MVACWADAEAKVAVMATAAGTEWGGERRTAAVGQQRLVDLHTRGEVLDDNLYTAPARYGGGGAGSTWLIVSAADIARSLRKYQDDGISSFILSDTPSLAEIKRQGSQLPQDPPMNGMLGIDWLRASGCVIDYAAIRSTYMQIPRTRTGWRRS